MESRVGERFARGETTLGGEDEDLLGVVAQPTKALVQWRPTVLGCGAGCKCGESCASIKQRERWSGYAALHRPMTYCRLVSKKPFR